MYYLCEQFDTGCLPQPLQERYRVADGPAIKVALFLLCGGSGEEEKIADALSMPAATVRRSLAFWKKAGLITDDPALVKAAPLAKKAAARTGALSGDRKPLTPSRMSEMSLRNPEIAVLLQEAQNFLGRTLDSNESRMLLEIFEYDELPVDVILMIVAWCTPRAKSSRSIISMTARTAGKWREQGIETAADVENHLRLLELRELREKQVALALELESANFNATQRSYIARWFEEYNYDIEFVKEAYVRSGNSSVNYINAILKGWHQQGHRTLRDVAVAPSNAPAPVNKKKGDEPSLLKRAVDKRKARVTDVIQ